MIILANNDNSINYTEEILIQIIEASLYECNGVVGAVYEQSPGKWDLLKSDQLKNGIKFTVLSNGKFQIELNIMIHFGAKIISSFIVQKIKENIENCTELNVDMVRVNIKAIDIQKKVLKQIDPGQEKNYIENKTSEENVINSDNNLDLNYSSYEENIIEESNEDEILKESEHKQYGILTFVTGKGLTNIFNEYGADQVIEYDQDDISNVKTNIILEKINKINADTIFIFENDKNLFKVCDKVEALSKRDLKFIKTKTIPEGIACITVFNKEEDIETNINEFNTAIENVKTGIVRRAAVDTTIGDTIIKEGNILGYIGDSLEELEEDPKEVIINILDAMNNKDSKLISIYYGDGVDPGEAESIKNLLEKKCKAKIDVVAGLQKEYYIVSVE